ncbi:MAG: hypothetical protein RIS36_491 [Pseudomonadota bacterium]|jgi:hypothetical protein
MVGALGYTLGMTVAYLITWTESVSPTLSPHEESTGRSHGLLKGWFEAETSSVRGSPHD